jgi:hypothetical protein
MTTCLGRAARAAGIALAILSVSCSGDRPTLPGTGAILLRLSFPDAGMPRPDSVRIEIRDSDDLRVAGVTTALPATGPLETSIEIEVDADSDFRALAQAEGLSPLGRAAIGFGSVSGLDVVGGKTTEGAIAVRSSIPRAPSIDGQPGVPSYTVRWNRVPGALSYLLRQSDGVSYTDYSVSDTSRTIGPGLAAGAAGLRDEAASRRPARIPSTFRIFRVRSVLPLGTSWFGDSTKVDLDVWQDLPYVTEVIPGDGASGVPDTTEIRVRFDRPMNPSSLIDTLVSLRPRDGGPVVPCSRGVVFDNTEVVLRPLAPLERGSWYRVRASTSLLDAEGRPLDQDAELDGLQAFVSVFRAELYDPLRATSCEPIANDVDVPVDVTIRVRMNRAVDPATLTSVSFTVSDTSGAISGLRRTAEQGSVLEFVPARPLSYDLIYTIRLTPDLLDGARHEPLDQDPLAAGFQPFISEFRTALQPRGPRVTWSEPLPGEPLFPVDGSPEIVFDRPIDPASVVFGSNLGLQLPLSGGVWVNVAGGMQVSTDSLRCVIVPSRPLSRDGRYRLLVQGGPGGLRDRHGNPLDQDFQTPGFQPYLAEFRTEENVRVLTVDPANNQQDVAWSSSVRVRFSAPVRPESVADTSFVLTKGTTPLAAVLGVSQDSLEATLTPLEPLSPDKVYRVRVGTGIRSRRGGSLDQNWDQAGHQVFESTFVTAPDSTSPMVVAVEPTDGTHGFGIDRGVRVHFSKPIRPSTLLGYFHLTASDSLGSEVAGTVTASPDSLSAFFAPDAPLANSTLYHVHVETWVRDRYGFRLDQDPETYWYQKFHSVFTTETEKVRPQVVAIDPPDGGEGVAVEGPVTVDFSEAMDRASLAAGLRVELEGLPVAGTFGFSNEDRTARWTPDVAMRPARFYRVVVDSLARDLAGNRLDQVPTTPVYDPFEAGFRTAADTLGPDVAAVDPTDGSTGVQIGIHPRLTFDEPIDPTTITLGAVTLVDSAGATVSTTQSLDAEGLTLELTPGVYLDFNRLYRINVYPTVADTSGNAFDDDPAAPGDQPFASTFRTQFETTPPRVLELVLDGGPPAPVDTKVRAFFSEDIDPASLGDTTFVVTLDGSPINGSLSMSASGDTAIFRPGRDLEYQTTYFVRIAGMRDLHGNPLDQDPEIDGLQPFEGSFTTGVDEVSPRVRRSLPVDGALGVDPDAPLRLTFSEAMDSSSFSLSDPGLFLDGAPVATTRTPQPGDSIFVFVASSPLTRGRTYEWRAGTALADRHGNTLDQDPGQAGAQAFLAEFEVGDRPIARAGAGICSTGDSTTVQFDAGASTDPDGTIVRVIWEWGDATQDTLDAPAGLTASHAYPCADAFGCDGLDSDDDGSSDEVGAEGCDESYHVRLTVVDADGLSASDLTGVSFCAFLVLSAAPPDSAVDVDTLTTASIRLSRACNPASADTNAVWLAEAGGAKVPCTLDLVDEDHRILLTPLAPLSPDTDYEIHATGLLTAATGAPLDQDPCVPDVQEFVATFHTLERPSGPPRR